MIFFRPRNGPCLNDNGTSAKLSMEFSCEKTDIPQVDWPTIVLYFEIMENVRNIKNNLLTHNWGKLQKLSYEFRKEDGTWEDQVREVYDRGNGVTILLYNTSKRTLILTRQFRIPTYLNGNMDGMMIEACAGKLDVKDPEECIKREVLEETGYEVHSVKKIMEVYMSPGSVTELIHFFIAPYDESMKRTSGGGLSSEQENIEVLEVLLDDAVSMIENGKIKDAKTIMLIQYTLLNKLV